MWHVREAATVICVVCEPLQCILHFRHHRGVYLLLEPARLLVVLGLDRGVQGRVQPRALVVGRLGPPRVGAGPVVDLDKRQVGQRGQRRQLEVGQVGQPLWFSPACSLSELFSCGDQPTLLVLPLNFLIEHDLS